LEFDIRVGEKLLHWTDTTPSKTHILTWLSLYWLTRSYPTSIYPYRSSFPKLSLSTHPGPLSDTRDLGKELKGAYVEKPMGYSKFPYELIPTPESWAGKTGNMVFFKEHDVGQSQSPVLVFVKQEKKRGPVVF
jgi:microsomal epoxide hydrolase